MITLPNTPADEMNLRNANKWVLELLKKSQAEKK